jgi:hypothetical protein
MVNPIPEILTMDEEKAEQMNGEPGSLSIGPAVSDMSEEPQNEPVTQAGETAQGPVEEPVQAPVHETAHAPAPVPMQAQADIESVAPAPQEFSAAPMPKAAPFEPTRIDADKAEAAKAEAVDEAAVTVKADAPEAAKADAPNIPGNVIIMSSGDRAWADHGGDSKAEADESTDMFGKRRIAALAAMVALATVSGVLGGALATAALMHGAGRASANYALAASVARIDADILALKSGLENNSRLGMSQFSKTSERLDRIEKAQVEPSAKFARLSEAVEKLRAAPVSLPVPSPAAAAPVAAKDVTGSVSPSSSPSSAAPKVEVGRLPTVDGWVLRDVANGGALIEGRHGVYEVYAGDPVPGLGRIDAIRRQDGRWVVVTSRGLVVAR